MAWTDLPARCLVLVLRNLPNFHDQVVFSAVCRRWRAVTQSYHISSKLPWLVMPSTAATTFFSLASWDTRPLRLPTFAIGTRLCGSFPGGWLLADSRTARGGDYSLFNLLTSEVVGVPGDLLIDGRLGEEELPVHAHAAAFSAAPSAPSYHVAAILSGHPALAFWRPGETHWRTPRRTAAPFDKSWRCLLPAGRIEDVLYHTGKACEGFHVLTDREALFVYKPGADAAGALTMSVAFYDFGKHQAYKPAGEHHTVARYLVESRGDLLMVARVVSPEQRTARFAVFVLGCDKLHGSSLPRNSVTSIKATWSISGRRDAALSGQKIVLGRCCSVAFEQTDHASQFGICFLDDASLVHGGPYPCGDTGVALPAARRIQRTLPRQPSSSDCSPWVWFFPAEVVTGNFSEAQPDAPM